jgi:hypothetical protein
LLWFVFGDGGLHLDVDASDTEPLGGVVPDLGEEG